MCGVVLYGETVTPQQFAGYCVSLTAFGVYNYLKIAESSSKVPESSKGKEAEAPSDQAMANPQVGLGTANLFDSLVFVAKVLA